ncbi:hypothetical protein SUGI_1184100 [Cryptomeria japonica]|nr:hypothetical protein SUGI_1184100 [Cryptomeria japonica]
MIYKFQARHINRNITYKNLYSPNILLRHGNRFGLYLCSCSSEAKSFAENVKSLACAEGFQPLLNPIFTDEIANNAQRSKFPGSDMRRIRWAFLQPYTMTHIVSFGAHLQFLDKIL